MNKEERQFQKDERQRKRNDRMLARKARQQKADLETYGEDSMLLANQSSSKGDGRGGIWDVSTSTYEPVSGNQDDPNSTVQEAGIDSLSSNPDNSPSGGSDGGGGGDSTALTGAEIVWSEDNETFISREDILESYSGSDYWSIAFNVTDNVFTESYDFDDDPLAWDDTGSNQTKYRLRVKTTNGSSPVDISTLGQYRPSIACVNGEPVTILVKVS